jgi:hypothetical protein
MLANFKCNEVKGNALQEVELDIQWFIGESSGKTFEAPEFINKCDSIRTKAVEYYTIHAKNYLKYVFDEIKKQLAIELGQRLNVCFANQAKKLIPLSQKNMRTELESEIKKSSNI